MHSQGKLRQQAHKRLSKEVENIGDILSVTNVADIFDLPILIVVYDTYVDIDGVADNSQYEIAKIVGDSVEILYKGTM